MNAKKKYNSIIFLDIDGVLNCQIWYNDLIEKEAIAKYIGTSADMDPWRVGMLNEVCKETNSAVVISSSWRLSGLQYCVDALKIAGATFDIIDVTPHIGYARGTDIAKWLYDNAEKWFGVSSHEFHRYAIIDDDSDMLLNQGPHFFKTDGYSGLTPNTCYKIKRFLIHMVGNNVVI